MEEAEVETDCGEPEARPVILELFKDEVVVLTTRRFVSAQRDERLFRWHLVMPEVCASRLVDLVLLPHGTLWTWLTVPLILDLN